MPKISIVIPTLNRSKTIGRAVSSVVRQTFQDWEIIIVDGGSTDGTQGVVKGFNDQRIILVQQANTGVADAMNQGFGMVSGIFCAGLDDDNFFEKDTFNKVVSVIDSHPDIDLIYGNVNIINDQEEIIKTYRPPTELNFNKLLRKTTGALPVQPAVFFRSSLFKKTTGFSTRYKVASDVDFWFKLFKHNPKCYYLNETFGYYLRDEKATSQSLRGIRTGLKEMLAIGKSNGQTKGDQLRLICKYTAGYINYSLKRLEKFFK